MRDKLSKYAFYLILMTCYFHSLDSEAWHTAWIWFKCALLVLGLAAAVILDGSIRYLWAQRRAKKEEPAQVA